MLKELLENYLFLEKNQNLLLFILNDPTYYFEVKNTIKIVQDLRLGEYRFSEIEDAIHAIREEILNERS